MELHSRTSHGSGQVVRCVLIISLEYYVQHCITHQYCLNCTRESITKINTRTPTLEHRYFTHWENLLNLEAGDISSVRSALWRLPTTRRVREGTCVRPLMLSSHGNESTTEYTFVLGSRFVSEEEKKTLCKGDMIVVSFETQSTQKTHFAVGAGTLIVELTLQYIFKHTHTHIMFQVRSQRFRSVRLRYSL